MANFNIDYLIVAGGGGGGTWRAPSNVGSGGGGGAGGLRTSFTGGSGGGCASESQMSAMVAGTPYAITVGKGGAGQPLNTSTQSNGGNSIFNGITSEGGGAGGAYNGLYATVGGSGGGGGYNAPSAAGTICQGFAGAGGGLGVSPAYRSGGGGGSGGLGIAPASGGSGGVGKSVSITATPVIYAAGGGGGVSFTYSVSPGGSGIGGNGGNSSTNASNPTANTGSGGGAGGVGGGSNTLASAGSSGVIILKYPSAYTIDTAQIGSDLSTTNDNSVSGYTITTIICANSATTGTGTITFTTPTPPFSGTKVTNPVTGFNSATEEGLKLPSGTNASQPTGVQGMIRNNTGENTGGSVTAIEHFNGTAWQYFAATESADNPLPAGAQIVYSASDATSYPPPQTGSTWFDISGNSNDATLANTTYSNGYLSFNGSSSKVTTSYSTNTSNASFAAWVNCNNVSTYNNFINQGYYSSGSNTKYFSLNNYANASPVFTIRDGGSSASAQSSVAMTNNTWHHVVGTVSSTGDMKIYLDGTETGSQTGAPARNMTQSILSGVWLDGNQQFFSGEISKIQVYDVVLTSTEVANLHAIGSGTT